MADEQDLLQSASIAIQRNDFETAKSILDKIIRQPDQRTPQSLLMYGTALKALELFDEAVSAFKAAEELAPEPGESAKFLNHAAIALIRKNNINVLLFDDMNRAATWLEQSKLLDPSETNAIADIRLCQIYHAIQKYDAIKTCAERLLNFPAYHVPANLWLARACYFLGDKAQGLVYLSTLEKSFDELDQLTQRRLLSLLVDFQCFTQAESIINRLLPERKHASWFQEMRASIFYEKKDYNAALKILSDSFVFTRALKEKTGARPTYHLRAKVLQAMGNYQDAHKDFTAMNQLARTSYKQIEPDDPVTRYSAITLEDLPIYHSSQVLPYTPVFMIGFPRSGTTLLETILGTQTNIQTLSEVGGIAIVKREIEQLGKTFPEDITTLTEQEIDQLRVTYFEHNNQFLDTKKCFSILVDKLPLNLIQIPLIKTLFPDAKFIFSLRHPVDVCLSCFQQDFALNDAMFHFTDLEQSFMRYRDTMELFEKYRTKLDLNLLTVRYEDLITDLDHVASKIFEFLNVTTDNRYRDFHKLNQQKIISTPSRAQVSQPLYQSSQYRWKHYADQLEPYIPLVQRFVTQYGYTI
jgi:tetratricopeptide (TPR) repeat protein